MHDSYAALRIAPFRWFIASLWTITLGTQIQMLVVSWQIYEMTRDPLSLGLIGLAEAIPFISSSLFSGHLADRLERKRIALVATFAHILCTAALLAFTLYPSTRLHGSTWPIYAVVFLSGFARSVLKPAATALSAQMMPRELYGNSIAWRTSTWQSAAVIGPAVGGVLYAAGGAAFSYIVALLLMVISQATLFLIKGTFRAASVGERESLKESLATGLRFVFGNSLLVGALSLDLFSVLFGGAVALLPIFAVEILHVGPRGLGLLRAAPAVGSVLMGIALAHRPPLRKAGRALLIAVALFGVSMIAFALSKNFYLSLFILAFSGAVDNISIVVRSTLLQVYTPPEMLGRVSAVNQIFIGSSNEIGAFESGVAARFMGTVPSVVFGGFVTLLVVAVVALQVPALRRLGRIEG